MRNCNHKVIFHLPHLENKSNQFNSILSNSILLYSVLFYSLFKVSVNSFFIHHFCVFIDKLKVLFVFVPFTNIETDSI